MVRVRRKNSGASEMKTTTAQATVRGALEENLAAVLRLKSKSRQLGVSLLITALALAVLLFLELEDFLEGSLGYRRGDIVFPVQVLHAFVSIRARCLRSQDPHAHTTSPSKRTFSPRTRKMPRGTSA